MITAERLAKIPGVLMVAKPPTVEEITVLLMESLELLHEADTVNTDDFDERLEAFFAKARAALR